ncbi:hypothetical protein ACFPYJ_15065 [Paenibacillus solisilvae]|uniref:Uncharacterized protein n=1 Tax=Paenibacillus solisilvae TaxID=2486751 RepID=A0ABW0VYY0_9BACL
MNKSTSVRYPSLLSNDSGTVSILHPINPWIPLWWSAAFPGYGHLLMNNYLIGYFLVLFEFIVNNLANVNLSIYLSMIGDFSQAKEVINLHFIFIYIGLYVFSIYDSYRRAVELNNSYKLSYRKTTQINTNNFSPYSINTLNKSNPLVALYWSFIIPGLGALYNNRLASFFYSIFWWGTTVYFSKFYIGLYYTCIGQFDRTRSTIDPQWYLFIPSIFGGVLYSAYWEAVKTKPV